MSQPSGLVDLPAELLLLIAKLLNNRDLSSLSRLNRLFHWRLFHPLFESSIARYSSSVAYITDLFFHAVKHDSANIAQYLIYSSHQTILNGPIPTRGFHHLPNFTFLHFALLADAPRVAAHLIKSGADIRQDVDDYPDLTPLYLTIPRSLISGQKELDSALRIACSYALPRTAGFLLTRGANVNTTSAYGIAALHIAVMRRPPWRELSIVFYCSPTLYTMGKSMWESMVLKTICTLLDFGADVSLQTQTSRTHECDPKCWRSVDCDRPGQTALHLASASGMRAVVSRLLDAGADHHQPDGQGYTALYAALVQGHKDVACRILDRCLDSVNPVVNLHEQTTALHVASRFSFPEMVIELLRRGADANTLDTHGRVPLHVTLLWARPDRDEDVILTLGHLVEFDADPDVKGSSTTPRQLAERHESMRIRDMFLIRQERTRARRIKRNPQSQDYSSAECKTESSTRLRREPEEPSFPQGIFPDLTDAEKVQLEAKIGLKLEKSVWAPNKTAQLAKGLETSKTVSDQDDAKPAVQEQFPELTVKASGNTTRTSSSTAGTWSATGTAQLMKNLQARAPSSEHASQSQVPSEEFPTLCRPARISANAAISEMRNAEATQSWGSLTKQTASVVEDAAVRSSENIEGTKARKLDTRMYHDRKKKRWTPLRF